MSLKLKLISLLVVLLIPVFLVAAAPETMASPLKPPFPVWPIPREIKLENERLLLTNAVIVVPAGDRQIQYPGRLLAELIADQYMVVIPVSVGKAPEGKTPIFVGEISTPLISEASSQTISKTNPGAEGYWLRIGARGAVIAGCDYRGTLYGVSSFIQLVHFWGHQSVAVWQATIKDWPFLPVRWVHVYVPGKEMLPFARRYFRDFLLRYKFNGMIMEIGGECGSTAIRKSAPVGSALSASGMPMGRRFSKPGKGFRWEPPTDSSLPATLESGVGVILKKMSFAC
jgi:hypothetical protein